MTSHLHDYIFAIQEGSREAFGALIKRWAKDPTSAPAGVMSMEQFARLMEDEGIAFAAPTREGFEIRHVHIYHGMLGRLDMRIPPKAMVEASEALLAAEDYPIPAYYFELFPGATPHVPDKLRLQRLRIADYTISNCA